MKAPRKITTQVDLARILGVDRSSVSLALSQSDKISAETRKLVLAAARKYHYRPNLAAQQLRSAKSNSLGLVIPDTFQALSEPVVVRTIQALASFAAKQGMIFTVLSTAAFTEPGARMHLPDGIFVWGDVAADTLKGRLPKGHPMLVLDPNHPSYARDATPSIGPDNAGGAAALVRHLLARGVQRLLFVIGLENHLGHAERWNGAQAEWLLHQPTRSLAYARLVHVTDEALRKFSSAPDGAILCSSDGGAIEIWRRLKDLGIAMPGDVRLAGFDNTPAAQLIGLTSAVFDCERLAENALLLMLKLVADEESDSSNVLIPVTVHEGKTT